MATPSTVNANYKVTLYERAKTYNRFTALLGDGVPTPSTGGGGYQIVTLPQRGAVTIWQGRPSPLLIDLPLRLVDESTQSGAFQYAKAPGFFQEFPLVAHLETLTQQINRLIAMWRPADPTIAPPVLKLVAKHNLVPYSNLPFVLNDFQWGAAQATKNGYRIIQDITVQLLEYRADEQLQAITVKSSSSKPHQTVYTVKSGDTLTSIAKRFGIKNGWKAVGQAQHPPIVDPRNIKVGERLSIPAHG